MNLKKLSTIFVALAFGFAFVACDDSSSGPSPEPGSSESQGPSDVTPMSSDSETSVSSSSAAAPASSATKECFKEGMADITVRNMERRSITCPNSSTIYDYDLQILYKCVGDALIETDMAPCGSDEPSGVTPQSSDSETSVSSSGTLVDYGTLTDARDGKSYKTVVIGGKTWMAENLNYDRPVAGSIDSTFCYDDVPANCEKYGRLYQEYAAKDACPEGWRLPTASDWIDLVNAVSEKFGSDVKNGALRAVGVWEDTIFGDNVVATNASGFSALPAGYRASTGECDGEGTKAYFWGEDNMNRYAWILSNQYDLDKESIMRGYFAYAVRCISAQE